MKIIKQLSDHIEEEISDATAYVNMAIANRDDFPTLSDTLYKISLDEMRHMSMLHEEVAKIIQQYRAEHGDPPEKMMAIYEYLHEKNIEAAGKAKALQNMYSDRQTP